MLTYPQINPVAFQVGPIAVHWYGLMYLISFISCWAILVLRARSSPHDIKAEAVSDIILYAALGVILGGRLGYMIFYDWYDVIHHPLKIIQVWEGGMSFHGGLIGVLVALWIYAYQTAKSVGQIWDFIAPAIPLGLAFGRIGNFINGELWGRVTNVPWAMIFPHAGDLPRHPSQLYEFFLEGVVMFLILWIYSIKKRPRWAVSGLFLILYSVFRIFVEFFREPDQQIGFIAWNWLTEGQLLSFPMLIAGIMMMVWAYTREKKV